jgi:hypothetical protein
VIDEARAIALDRDKVGILQFGEVNRQCRLAQVKVTGKLARTHRPLLQQCQNLAPHRMRQCFEDIINCHRSIFSHFSN